MQDSLWTALALLLILEGLLPFVAPRVWRETLPAADRAHRRPAALHRPRSSHRRSACTAERLASLRAASMRNWLLPEAIEDVLPDEAARLEALRRTLLDHFAAHGYRLVQPPLDRAPRFAADRHRTRPRPADVQGRRPAVGPAARRARRHHAAGRAHRRAPAERGRRHAPLLRGQRAAHRRRRRPARRARSSRSAPSSSAIAGIDGDREVIALLAVVAGRGRRHAGCISTSATSASIARSRAAPASRATATTAELFDALRDKDAPAVRALTRGCRRPGATRSPRCPRCTGPAHEVLAARARAAAGHAGDRQRARRARRARRRGGAASCEALHIDLADLRGYHYHNGAIFSVFTAGEPTAIGNGGRYDGIGKAFGRARPATGFTLDLRQLADVLARGSRSRRLTSEDRFDMGKNVVVIGTQWGDEGKGKIVDWLTESAQGVVRFQGGHNAGHTLVIGGTQDGAAAHPVRRAASEGVAIYIGNGVVLSPSALLQEIGELEAAGVERALAPADLAGVPAGAADPRRARPGARVGDGRRQDRHDRPRHRPRVRGQDRAPRAARAGPARSRALRRASSKRCSSSTTSCWSTTTSATRCRSRRRATRCSRSRREIAPMVADVAGADPRRRARAASRCCSRARRARCSTSTTARIRTSRARTASPAPRRRAAASVRRCSTTCSASSRPTRRASAPARSRPS